MSTNSTRVGSTFGKYRLDRLLGKGGMGEVYEAYDTEKRRSVAIKILAEQYSQDEQFRTRFQRESHAAAILQEPHVIPIHDWGEIEGNLYIDMRLVKGSTLHELLERGPVEPQRAVAIIEQIAAALDAAHNERLIHRDVKPQNIIITPGDFAYLLDFGIAEAQDDSHLTVAGYQIGTFDYMAPERFSDRPTTPAADVYSLACVLHEALTGKRPFPAGSAEQVMSAHLTSPPPRPSIVNRSVSASFDKVISRGMAKDPDDRYGSAGALGRGARRALQAEASNPSQADTMLAGQYNAPPVIHQPIPGAVSAPPTVPSGPLPSQYPHDHSRTWVLPTVVAVAAAVLLSSIGVVIGLLVDQRSERTAAPAATNPSPTPSAYSTPESATDETQVPTLTTTTSAAEDSEVTSAQRLQQLAASDRPYVSEVLADRWVPQLSSKRPGVFDEGHPWDNNETLQEHLRLRRQYPGVRLLWSGDWSTFSDSNFWVTIVGITFTDSSGALSWCRSQGFDADHCAAKVVSATLPVEGSTAYNR